MQTPAGFQIPMSKLTSSGLAFEFTSLRCDQVISIVFCPSKAKKNMIRGSTEVPCASTYSHPKVQPAGTVLGDDLGLIPGLPDRGGRVRPRCPGEPLRVGVPNANNSICACGQQPFAGCVESA